MNRNTTAILVVAIVLLFVFLVPVIPASSLLPGIAQIPGHLRYIHYYKSISGLFLPVGTSFWSGQLYFHPNPFWGAFA